MQLARNCKSTVIPGVRYKDCLAAIEWLCNALGFEKQAVYMGEGDAVEHAQLTFGNGMVMLGSYGRPSPYNEYSTIPAEVGMRETHSVSLIAADDAIEEMYFRALKAGAEVIFELETKHYGGKSFSIRDPEGYLWHVGTYDPWA